MAKLDANELDKAHKDLKTDARQRVAQRGLLQFRADPETVTTILQLAEERQMPVGTLLRQWVQDRLSVETGNQKAPDLVQRVVMLEEAVTDLKRKLG